MFFGFSTENENSNAAIQASQDSAASMLEAFRSFAPEVFNNPNVSIVADGFGNVGYMNCVKNERTPQTMIEVWVRPV